VTLRCEELTVHVQPEDGEQPVNGPTERYATATRRDKGIEAVKANAPTARTDDQS